MGWCSLCLVSPSFYFWSAHFQSKSHFVDSPVTWPWRDVCGMPLTNEYSKVMSINSQGEALKLILLYYPHPNRNYWLTKSNTTSEWSLSTLRQTLSHTALPYNWRVRWKRGVRYFTQNWTLSKTLQISHAALFRCVKQCSVCFLAEVCLVFKILCMQKTCICSHVSMWLQRR